MKLHQGLSVLLLSLLAGVLSGREALVASVTSGEASAAALVLSPDGVFGKGAACGFEPGVPLSRVSVGGLPCLMAEQPFFLTVAVPSEGNYRVTVQATDLSESARLSIKAELRRLLVRNAVPVPGRLSTFSFVVNTRTPRIPASANLAAGEVKLKAPRETTKEAWAWDSAITLEFNGEKPALHSVRIEPVDMPTVFLIGDSTVCDQSAEPYASWGQMLTALFDDTVAVANHAESGETLRDSIGRRRLDKIVSLLRPGDYLFIQFGHNDQKQASKIGGGAFSTYLAELKQHIAAVRATGAIPVVVSPMERRQFDAQAQVLPSLLEYAQAARKAAEEEKAAFIDLNAMSKILYQAVEATGRGESLKLFAPGDATHHCNYGAYEIARCIAQGIRDLKLPLAKSLRAELSPFDPSKPDDAKSLQLSPSPGYTNQRPLGDTAN